MTEAEGESVVVKGGRELGAGEKEEGGGGESFPDEDSGEEGESRSDG